MPRQRDPIRHLPASLNRRAVVRVQLGDQPQRQGRAERRTYQCRRDLPLGRRAVGRRHGPTRCHTSPTFSICESSSSRPWKVWSTTWRDSSAYSLKSMNQSPVPAEPDVRLCEAITPAPSRDTRLSAHRLQIRYYLLDMFLSCIPSELLRDVRPRGSPPTGTSRPAHLTLT